jgi:hypothetical protein
LNTSDAFFSFCRRVSAMGAFAVSLKDRPDEVIEVGPISTLEALQRLKARGLERAVAAEVNGELRRRFSG